MSFLPPNFPPAADHPLDNPAIDAFGQKWVGEVIVDGAGVSRGYWRQLFEVPGGTGTLRGVIPAAATPNQPGELVFVRTSDTAITLKLRGADNQVRSATITLA